VTGVFSLLRLRVLALVGLCASAVVHTAFGQEGYPNRTIKLIVPFAAGGNGDAVGRLTAYYMQKVLDVNVVVENRPGAGGINGTDAVTKSPPDEYTLCVCSTGPITVAPWTEAALRSPQGSYRGQYDQHQSACPDRQSESRGKERRRTRLTEQKNAGRS
jgi:hypothetical protein